MGRHSAGDGAGVHPLVAQALQRREGAVAGSAPPRSANGWPDPPYRGDGGVGWPQEPRPAAEEHHHEEHHHEEHHHEEQRHEGDDGSVLAVLDEAAARDAAAAPNDVAPTPAPARRSGWRRLFGGGRTSAPHDTSAA